MELILLIAICIIAWFWLDSLAARDAAVAKGHDLVQRTNLQLLDETVSCTRLRIGRNGRGHVQFLRTFEFEVSANGADRMYCTLVLLGKELQSWYIPPYLQAVN
ncbi:MAG TPA: DUF3301 domain-containing protein [Methylophilaceae bacterium]